MKIGRLISAAALCLVILASIGLPQKTEAQINGNRRREFVYAANQDSNTLSAFRRLGDGTLVPLQTIPTGSAPNGAAVNPRGAFVYIPNILSNDVSGYAISPNGTLTEVPGSPFPAGSGPGWISVDPTGRFVYVANCAALCSGSGPGSVSGYAINQSTGALVPVPGSPF